MATATERPGVDWTVAVFVVGYHLLVLVGLPIYLVHRTPSAALLAISAVLLLATEIGIGGGYHRYYSHRCYALRRPAEALFLFLATLATQGSALRWSHDHRKHHAHVDTDDDPYSIRKGFWYAHCLWLFKRSGPIDPKWVPDLLKNPLVRFQHRWAGTLSVLSNLLLFLAVGWLVGDWWGAFFLAWWGRLLLSHHLTWFVNSLAHCWGEQTYSKEHSAVDNYILAFLTVGEGYHNYHHTFPADYRNGVRWFHFDPVKWTVWTLSKAGLAQDLRRFDDFKIKKRLLNEDRKLLLRSLAEKAHAKKAELEAAVEALSKRMHEDLNRLGTLSERRRLLRRGRGERERVAELRREIRTLRERLRADWKAWYHLCGVVLEPARA